MSRYPRRRRCVRYLPHPWTPEDIAIAAHLPDWQRADYKLSDRLDADHALTNEEARHGQVNETLPGNSGRAAGSSMQAGRSSEHGGSPS